MPGARAVVAGKLRIEPGGGSGFVSRMAWRIDEAVIRGEIDNRVRGRVTGRIWFVGKEAPVELDLAGDAWRDLAGRRLEFVNPQPKALELLERFPLRQTGVIGDCTASRKVKVPDIPMDQIGEYYAAKKKWTWHWGNCLYLEWFSTTNGRVVIESVSYQMTVSPDMAWEMTEAEEERQRRANAEAMGNFMERLGQAVADSKAREAAKGDAASDEANEAEADATDEAPESGDEGAENGEADEEKPLTEEDAEKMDAENELLLDRINARMEREGDAANFEQILDEELQRRRRGDPPLTPEQEAERDARMEAMERAADDIAANPDPAWREIFDRKHPVAERAEALAVRLMDEPEERGWVTEDMGEEHPLVDMAAAAMKAAVKFGGSLNGDLWPPDVRFCANTIVRLKKARSYLNDALCGAEICTRQRLAEPVWIAEMQRELNGLAHACDTLIGELRARLTSGE